MGVGDEELTRSEKRAAKRRVRNEAAKAQPYWFKVTTVTVVAVVGIAVVLWFLNSRPPKYVVYDTQVGLGVTAYKVRVPIMQDGDLLAVVQDIWSKDHGSGGIAVRIECGTTMFGADPYLGGGTVTADGDYKITTPPGAKCP